MHSLSLNTTATSATTQGDFGIHYDDNDCNNGNDNDDGNKNNNIMIVIVMIMIADTMMIIKTVMVLIKK